MSPVIFAIVPAVMGVGWSVTVRRATWANCWERPNTLSVALQGVALTLMAPPQSRYLGHWLKTAFGVPHLDDYLGHLCYMAVAACIVYAAACRVANDRRLQSLTLWAAIPGVIAAHVMLAALVCSRTARANPGGDFFGVPTDGPLITYWVAYSGEMMWALGVAIRLLLVLRRDPRSRLPADLFIAACACGSLAGIVRIYSAWTPDPGDGDIEVWVLACVGALLSATGAALSWRTKTRPFRAPPDLGPPPGRSRGRDETPPRGTRFSGGRGG